MGCGSSSQPQPIAVAPEPATKETTTTTTSTSTTTITVTAKAPPLEKQPSRIIVIRKATLPTGNSDVAAAPATTTTSTTTSSTLAPTSSSLLTPHIVPLSSQGHAKTSSALPPLLDNQSWLHQALSSTHDIDNNTSTSGAPVAVKKLPKLEPTKLTINIKHTNSDATATTSTPTPAPAPAPAPASTLVTRASSPPNIIVIPNRSLDSSSDDPVAAAPPRRRMSTISSIDDQLRLLQSLANITPQGDTLKQQALTRLATMARDSLMGTTMQTCSNCDDIAVLRCRDCVMVYCQMCNKGFHLPQSKRRHHREPLMSELPTFQITSYEHEVLREAVANSQLTSNATLDGLFASMMSMWEHEPSHASTATDTTDSRPPTGMEQRDRARTALSRRSATDIQMDSDVDSEISVTSRPTTAMAESRPGTSSHAIETRASNRFKQLTIDTDAATTSDSAETTTPQSVALFSTVFDPVDMRHHAPSAPQTPTSPSSHLSTHTSSHHPRRFSMLIRKHMHMRNDSMEQAKVLARLAETEVRRSSISLSHVPEVDPSLPPTGIGDTKLPDPSSQESALMSKMASSMARLNRMVDQIATHDNDDSDSSTSSPSHSHHLRHLPSTSTPVTAT